MEVQIGEVKGGSSQRCPANINDYKALDYDQQHIFLEIARLFNDQKMIDSIYFWESCKFYPNSGIKILVQRSLIKVHDHGTLWMHDQLRDLGRAIAQPQMAALGSHFPAGPSRLWSPEYALDALRKKEVNFYHGCNYFILQVSSHNLVSSKANIFYLNYQYSGK